MTVPSKTRIRTDKRSDHSCEATDAKLPATAVRHIDQNTKFTTLCGIESDNPPPHTGKAMIQIRDLFESHVTVSDLQRSMTFYGEVLGLELAHILPERRVAFYWIGGRGASMLGLWEVGTGPQRLNLHIAFRAELSDLLRAPESLRAANVAPLDFEGNSTNEPVVFMWMPAASLFFHDPDGNLLEFLSILPDRPDLKLGVVSWTHWTHRRDLT